MGFIMKKLLILMMLFSGVAHAERVRDIGPGRAVLERIGKDVLLTFNKEGPQYCKKENFDPMSRRAYPIRVWDCGGGLRVAVGNAEYGTAFRKMALVINGNVIYDSRIDYPE